MPTDKGTWWIITAYNDDISTIENEADYPIWVAEVHGGREEGDETHRLHFQGALRCRGQQRFSRIKEWLPSSHIELANSKDAIRKYCMKDDTAVGEKEVRTNPNSYMKLHDICQNVYDILLQNPVINGACNGDNVFKYFKSRKDLYWHGVSLILSKSPEDSTCYASSNLPNFWANTFEVWAKNSKIKVRPGYGPGPLVLQGRADTGTVTANEIFTECPICGQYHDWENEDECP